MSWMKSDLERALFRAKQELRTIHALMRERTASPEVISFLEHQESNILNTICATSEAISKK